MKYKNYLFLLSFIEGGAVMACELVGAKLLAPYFGTSLYVWAAALALTLGGLTLGYFLGGRLSKRYGKNPTILFWVLICAGVLLVAMPFTSRFVMTYTLNLSLELGALCSLFVFMMPPLIFMGMVSPLIINLLTDEVNAAGNNAGNIYAISTLGGILMTLLMGFYIIPTFGLTGPAIASGLALSILPIISLLRRKNLKVLGVLVVMGLFSIMSFQSKEQFTDDYKILYQAEGILGQVKVVEHPSYEITPDARIGRGLVVNNTLQTFVGVEDNYQYSIWNWSNYFPTAASIFPKDSKVLLLGLGGGTLVKQLQTLGFEVDVVEIDKRVVDVSYEFFKMDRSVDVYIDDARHYINTSKKTYDIIIFDTFLSESVPEHLLTIEGFRDTKKILNENGMVMINFYGFIDGEKGRAARSVYKTLEESDFKIDILATPGSDENRNLIYLASMVEQDFTTASYDEPNFKSIDNLYDHFVDMKFINMDDAKILSDRKPQLSKLYLPASKAWKKSYNAYYQKYFIK